MLLIVLLVIVVGELLIIHYSSLAGGTRVVEITFAGKWLIDLGRYLQGKTIL